MVNLSLRVLSRPDERLLPEMYQELGLDYDERVLPSIINEVSGTDEIQTERHRKTLVKNKDL